MQERTKRVLFTAGAIFAFATTFALFGLIFYQLFRPDSREASLDAESAAGLSSMPGGNTHPLSGTPRPPKFVPTSSSSALPLRPPPSSPAAHSPPRRRLRKLWEARNDQERANLLVQSVNLNPNSTWSAQLNKFAIGLKPLGEMLNFSRSFDPLNTTFMMAPNRLKAIEELVTKVFQPLYDQHLIGLTNRSKYPPPDKFNSAQRWPKCAQSILRVRDQGGCGSCWAVAAVSVMSDRICIASEGQSVESLSAQQLIECCDYCGGCTGAPNSFFPFLYWHQEGIVSDRCFPYTIARDCGYPCPPSEFESPRGVGNCSCGGQQCADKRLRPARLRAKYVYKLGSLDEEENFFPPSLLHRLKSQPPKTLPSGKAMRALDLLKRELLTHGPVMLCFSVYEGFMHFYDGVYDFDLLPGEVHVYDHCAKVIGWGRQRRPNASGGAVQQEYLLLVNSWSSLWAKDGTFKIDLAQLGRSHSDLFAGVPL
uniref:Pept_C1 domain-containing protein n=1 Tax=Globodera pallida TaxID=36090 RepID=A0A183BZF9_GLOPA